MEIDYALAWTFHDDHDPRPYQLRFRRNSHFSDDGQLIAVVCEYQHPDNGHTIAISAPNVNFHEVERVLDGWQQWARYDETNVSLAAIRQRLHAARLT